MWGGSAKYYLDIGTMTIESDPHPLTNSSKYFDLSIITSLFSLWLHVICCQLYQGVNGLFMCYVEFIFI